MPAPEPIRIEGLTKTYRTALSRRSVRALDALTLQVGRGEIFGLLGPNGAGKTTLIKILLGVVRPSAGSATLFDLPVHLPQARQSIGYLPENHRFPDVFTAESLLTVYGRMGGVSPALLRERIPRLLALTGMTDWRKARIRTFSKGMMQRLGLAQALLNDPQIIFLDEPTDGVDPIGRREIRDILSTLKGEGKTIFLNSHLLSEVERLCDRIAILNKGSLVYEGNLENVGKVSVAYDITCAPIPEPLFVELAARFALTAGAPDLTGLARYHVEDLPLDRLNELIDRLRGAGITIQALLPQRRSLEDAFIQLLSVEGSIGGVRA
ncbi:MAG: ABC transporter ATP-binding protein [Rhodothermales bacterium]|nr:ABC transporter ATP-binding protein [Rhodothermales bacterium]